ncbi:MAG: PAS domain-containing protein [Salinivirgaceae bacterium]
MENKDKKVMLTFEELEKENLSLRNSQIPELFSFDFLFDAVKQPAFVIIANKQDNIPRIRKVNKSGVELVKYSQQEIENMSPIDLGLFNSMEQYFKFSTSLIPMESAIFLSHVKDKNGTAISSEITIYCFNDSISYHLIVFQRSIGNQQKVVEALRQSEYRFLQMAENIAEGIVIIEDEKKVFINSSICQITGFSKDEMRDMDEFGMALEFEKDRLRAFKEKLKESTQGIHSFEFWISTKLGVEKCIKNNYTLSKRTDGKQSTYIITSDVTARKRIEQALRKSQTDFRMLAENSPDLITRYNKDLTYLYVNQTFETLTGIPINQFIGRNNLELDLEPDLVSFLEEMHLEVFRTGRTLKFEFRLPTKTDTKVFQAHMVPELAKDGTVDSVLNVSRDITQIKQVERNLKEEKQNLIQENFKYQNNSGNGAASCAQRTMCPPMPKAA